jgi:hypothetical protein
MSKHFTVTPAQKEALLQLRNLLGEKGYVVCDVGDFFRRNEHDFVAYYRTNKRRFLVARPTRGGRISLTPFLMDALYWGLKKELLASAKSLPVKVLWSNRQLKFLTQRPDWWHQYFPAAVVEPSEKAGHQPKSKLYIKLKKKKTRVRPFLFLDRRSESGTK